MSAMQTGPRIPHGTEILDDPDVRDAAAQLWPGHRAGGAAAAAREERIAAAAWTAIAEPSDAVAGRLTQAYGVVDALRAVVAGAISAADENAAGRAAAEDVEARAGVERRAWEAAVARWQPRLVPSRTAEALRAASRKGLALVSRRDAVWPTRLDDLGDHAPVALWVRGDVDAISGQPAVAIVGARAATSYGEHVAGEIAGDLAQSGATIVSGGAYGVDGAAHRAALREGGPTVAVMAGGADRVYPAGHAHLLQRIAASGAVISEVAPGTTPTKFRFLKRNRVIACLGAATVVVEAASRSGSLSTAGAAAELGRPLGAVPGSILAATSAGCHRLLREYDAVCVTGADDVRELLTLDAGGAFGAVPLSAPLDPATMRVRDALGVRAWRTVDEIAARSGVSPVEATAALGLLSLEGSAESVGDAWRLAAERRARRH